MKRNKGVRLDDAVAAVREQEVDLRTAQSAGARVLERVVRAASSEGVDAIRGCGDVRSLLRAYAQGTLPPARTLLVQDHLRECAACRGVLEGTEALVAPWRHAASQPVRRPLSWRYAAALVAVLAVGVSLLGLLDVLRGMLHPSDTEVRSVTGVLYRVADDSQTPVRPGELLREGARIRTGRASRAVLQLGDGSSVEMNEHAELVLRASRGDTTLQLDRGSILVEAAKRRSGHLYVRAADCTVSVTGTVFSVSHGVKGSRVAVLEGEVRVRHGGSESVLRPGQQLATSSSLAPVPLRQQVAWSRNAERHLQLIAQLSELRRDLQAMPGHAVRYESRLLRAVPAAATVYVAAPNYGESLTRAHALFQQRLETSDVLRRWWAQATPHRFGPELATLVSKLGRLGEYLGDEVVLAFVPAPAEGSRRREQVLFLAEPRAEGLRGFLEDELFAGAGRAPRLEFVEDVAALPVRPADFYVSIRPDLSAVSSDLGTLRAAIAAFDGRAPGIEGTPFGRRIAEAYRDGTGLLVAADAARMRGDPRRQAAGGLGDVQYFLAERVEFSGRPRNSAELTFSGPRRGVLSWLGAAAPMGSLAFVSPDATAVAAGVTKDPARVFDDLLALRGGGSRTRQDLESLESRLQIHFREDLVAAFGNDFTLALDGPILPTPSFKLIAEVYDPARLEQTLEILVEAANRNADGAAHPRLRLDHEQVDGRTYHALSIMGRSPLELHYSFVDGYVVVAPSRALVMKAITVWKSGQSLTQSSRLRDLWPEDGNSDVSALLYLNPTAIVSSAAAGLAAAPGADRTPLLEALAAQAQPTLVYACAMDDRIEIAGDILRFDPSVLALPALLRETAAATPSRTGRLAE